MTDEQQQITDAFMRDFKDLLRRYDADFDLLQGDDYNATATAEIGFKSIYDYEKDKLVRPYINFQLPNHINPNR
jgi:hypothetical protein